jgi:hypothetical protein
MLSGDVKLKSERRFHPDDYCDIQPKGGVIIHSKNL